MVSDAFAVYVRPLTDAESRYLEAHTSHIVRSLSVFGLEACIILSLAVLALAAIRWQSAKPIQRPTYRRVSLLAKTQSVSFLMSVIVYWLTLSRFYYHDRDSAWPMAMSLVVLGWYFAISVAAIITLQSMHGNDGPLHFRKMWRGRKAVSTSVFAFLLTSFIAAVLFFIGIS